MISLVPTTPETDERAIPVLWVCGPPGVGKTAVAWQLHTQLTQAGIGSAYVDLDQLGICYPEPAGDAGRHRVKTANLRAVVAHFRAAGAQCVLVSGVVDTARGVAAEDLPRARLLLCRLRADHAELTRRFRHRQGAGAEVREVLREADALDAGGIGVCVDTTGRTVEETAALVRQRCGNWPAEAEVPAGSGAAPQRASRAGGEVLWLCGPTGVGKSATGFAVYLRTLRAGRTAAYVDLDQLAFHPRGGHRLTAANLAALWDTYHGAGARHLVITGPAENTTAITTCTQALPAARFAVCRLHATAEHLAHRITLRGRGEGWPQPGDPLPGLAAAQLHRVAEDAAAQAQALERAELGDVRVDTSARTVDQVVDEVLARTGWPAT
ncbi:AAA family ATPase [Saccharopolyspora hordei]|uniref:Adenylylsulfate kinase-like enzyme n=1 Tax=Saccharopolyspora hordei TaxID=1838 RepID=A0A853AS37_9PSEU|nr:AAA family ATPase [Saccharopolyspora hordei]NYI84680.1 adenylylsulfate kinase-like enzyme [Saccharopolyspora hordei]